MQRTGALPQAGLIARLRGRQAEIEEAILARVYGVADPTDVGDPAYVEGLRTAAAKALDYALDAIGHSDRHQEPIPIELPGQAATPRAAASISTLSCAATSLVTPCSASS